MPTDRTNTNSSRPLKPTLATTRTAKTPVAPRLAPSVASGSSVQSGRTPRSNAGATPRFGNASHEDLTPVKSFINSNVTPRSSSRKSRVGVGSAQSTPNGTPSGTPISTRPASTVDFPQQEQGHGYSGLGINGLNSAQNNRPRSVVGGNNYNTTPTPRPPLSNIYNHAPDAGGARAASPMFFHASDARPQEQAPPQKKAPVFFYANGQQDERSRAHHVPSPPLSSVGRFQPESKFFHADSLSEARSNPPILTPPPNSASPEPWASLNAPQGQHSLRPPSPSKENMHLSYRKGASQVLRPNLRSRPSALSILSGPHTPDLGVERSRRRSSAASSAVRLGHSKSASLSSIDSTHSLKKVPTRDLPAITASPLHNEKRVISNGSLPESVASAPLEQTEALSGLPSPHPMSPTKPQSALEHMNELAANARRERKVLDLEISNNSLLAINRSLEREVRKQKAELRRFRRMSRAGRFSTDTISNLEEFSAIGLSELGSLSDMSEEEDEAEEDEPEDSSESSFDESAMSPSALADRDNAHRLRDEKRLQLDLSKHRELLVDSQKMNQSLKRCLNWTEELIKDAQKALSYQVRVSDVQLGGRVLSSEEQAGGEQSEESKTLLSPWTPPHQAVDLLDQASVSDSERTDRDSGIDVDGMKAIFPGLQGFISPLASPLGETPTRLPYSGESMQELY
ncbi:hypothetical protein BU26DRAFT_415990 [Trematosphaeria pertusa]|uniref:Uncharacterized protein n=1 Tax=Trematosphaeria pertusa TaxID=390896 RepID=A0A6A6IWE6_9PLEO|nr:uncharacterized protein BU26DRAFT_415990 [Trematosphaeria pertusa]KAF2254608.1 hypothetical protein BU26DRAFT_415990 [Trematosphaeria pertusa]